MKHCVFPLPTDSAMTEADDTHRAVAGVQCCRLITRLTPHHHPFAWWAHTAPRATKHVYLAETRRADRCCRLTGLRLCAVWAWWGGVVVGSGEQFIAGTQIPSFALSRSPPSLVTSASTECGDASTIKMDKVPAHPYAFKLPRTVHELLVTASQRNTKPDNTCTPRSCESDDGSAGVASATTTPHRRLSQTSHSMQGAAALQEVSQGAVDPPSLPVTVSTTDGVGSGSGRKHTRTRRVVRRKHRPHTGAASVRERSGHCIHLLCRGRPAGPRVVVTRDSDWDWRSSQTGRTK